MVFQVGPIMRYIDSIIYGLKSRHYENKTKKVEKTANEWKEKTGVQKETAALTDHTPEVLENICRLECKAKQYYDLMLYEDADAAMLRLFECFMESAPQTILQLYILSLKFFACPKDPNQSHQLSRCKDNIRIDENDTLDVETTAEIVSIFLSITSIAWGLVAYHKALRFSRSDKLNVSHISCISIFLWRFFMLFPRVLLIALFASVFPAWHLAVFIGGHFFVMLVWTLVQPSGFCSSPVEERVFRFFAAVIHVFVFFNLLEGRTRFRSATFYTIAFIEQVAVVALWLCFASDHHSLTTKLTLIAVVFGSFFLGIFFMVFHYVKLHPNKADIPLCLDKDQIPFCGKQALTDEESSTGCHCSSTRATSNVDQWCHAVNSSVLEDEACCRQRSESERHGPPDHETVA